MVNECNDQPHIAKAGDGKPSFQSPLADHNAAGILKSACKGNDDAAMLQKHGFPKGDFWNNFTPWKRDDDKPFQNDGRDEARKEVTKQMPQDQQDRVRDQEKEYNRRLKGFRENMEHGTSMTKYEYPSLESPEFKDLKAREDAVKKKMQSK
jgi:hypothetical protein